MHGEYDYRTGTKYYLEPPNVPQGYAEEIALLRKAWKG